MTVVKSSTEHEARDLYVEMHLPSHRGGYRLPIRGYRIRYPGVPPRPPYLFPLLFIILCEIRLPSNKEWQYITFLARGPECVTSIATKYYKLAFYSIVANEMKFSMSHFYDATSIKFCQYVGHPVYLPGLVKPLVETVEGLSVGHVVHQQHGVRAKHVLVQHTTCRI